MPFPTDVPLGITTRSQTEGGERVVTVAFRCEHNDPGQEVGFLVAPPLRPNGAAAWADQCAYVLAKGVPCNCIPPQGGTYQAIQDAVTDVVQGY
jgi:hypothetical protein